MSLRLQGDKFSGDFVCLVLQKVFATMTCRFGRLTS